MIAYLEGTLKERTEDGCILLTPGGVGYELALPTSVAAGLPARGESMHLYVHTRVYQDGLDLYGFADFDQLGFFRTLISIDKLGPKKAMAILSRFSPEKLREVAFREDVKTLSTVPGIGPKSARQILWHLKDKVEKLAENAGAGLPGADPAAPAGPASEFFDALAGLKNLGYSEDEARPLLKQIFEDDGDMDATSALRIALKKMAANK